jgi:hypothetical protein
MNFLIEFSNNECPCRLGLFDNDTKMLESRQSEHGWRGMVSVLNLTPGMCLSQTRHIPGVKFQVRQYMVNREWGNICAGRRRNHFPFHVWLAQNWIGQRDYLAAEVCKKIAHSP